MLGISGEAASRPVRRNLSAGRGRRAQDGAIGRDRHEHRIATARGHRAGRVRAAALFVKQGATARYHFNRRASGRRSGRLAARTTRRSICRRPTRFPAMPRSVSASTIGCSPITAIRSSRSYATMLASTTSSFHAATTNATRATSTPPITRIACGNLEQARDLLKLKFDIQRRAGLECVHAQSRHTRGRGRYRCRRTRTRLDYYVARRDGFGRTALGLPTRPYAVQRIQPDRYEACGSRRPKRQPGPDWGGWTWSFARS